MRRVAEGLLLDDVIEKTGSVQHGSAMPRLLLHVCCAPCASHVLEYLSGYFCISAYFCNPCIKPREEYFKRAHQLSRLVSLMDYPNLENVIVCDYNVEEFDSFASGMMGEPEGGERCTLCFTQRLGKTAERAKQDGFDVFATTLSISPHKNAALINEIGSGIASGSGADYLISDFKKRGGFQRSIAISKKLGIYRQSYCGCVP